MKFFVFGISLIIVTAVIAGFLIIGSPQEERLRRFDERRVQDLSAIQSEIINYWTNKERLPQNITELRDDIRGFTPPRDPSTGADYEYQVIDSLEFALCANFDTASDYESNRLRAPEPYYGQQNWQHETGRVCFERKIDPEIYRPAPKVPKPF